MRKRIALVLALLAWGFMIQGAVAQQCPDRPVPGTTVTDPLTIHSQNGVLRAKITMRNLIEENGTTRYCYAYQDTEAPTLRVNPGDQIELELTNRLRGSQAPLMEHHHGEVSSDPCNGTMTSVSTNVHFHGLNVPSICHQDEVVHTLINPTDAPFRYRLRVPNNEPPGVYWYHPHPHGMTQFQVMGGASGVIIVEGIEKLKPEVAGLAERILIIRDQLIAGGGDLDAGNLSINFVPATYPATLPPVINMQPLEKQFWRVLNASGQKFQALQIQIDGVPQDLEVVAMDGTPLKTNAHLKTLLVPPAGRVEFIMQGPPAGVPANLMTLGVDTGVDGDPNPPHHISNIEVTNHASPLSKLPQRTGSMGPRRFDGLSNKVPITHRKLYFSEDLSDPDNPRFFITVDGQTPKQFDPDDPPAIVTQLGAIEDWTIENRSGEIHAFHMHQIHFLVLENNGAPVMNRDIRDTVKVLPWDGQSPTYPSVKLRMDFRYPENVGTFVYHCHILDHEDGGMMAKIEVDPKK